MNKGYHCSCLSLAGPTTRGSSLLTGDLQNRLELFLRGTDQLGVDRIAVGGLGEQVMSPVGVRKVIKVVVLVSDKFAPDGNVARLFGFIPARCVGLLWRVAEFALQDCDDF